MVLGDRDTFDELLDEDSSLGLGGGSPGPVEVEVLEDTSYLFETPAHVVGLLEFTPGDLRLVVRRRNGQGQASLLLGEQVGSDPVVVLQAQQLPPLPLQLVHCVQ
jgi:hypothetical protein